MKLVLSEGDLDVVILETDYPFGNVALNKLCRFLGYAASEYLSSMTLSGLDI